MTMPAMPPLDPTDPEGSFQQMMAAIIPMLDEGSLKSLRDQCQDQLHRKGWDRA